MKRFIFIGILLLSGIRFVRADSRDDFRFFEEEAKTVTASKHLEKISEAPATIIVLTKKDIQLRGYSNLRDIFKDLPGMEALDFYYSEFGTEVPVRGVLGNNKIVVLLNGMRVNPPGGEPMMFRGDFSVRDAERIEVMYGPGSTLYGQDAISLIVNVITKSPSENSMEVGAVTGTQSKKEGWASLFKPTEWGGVTFHVQALNSDLPNPKEEYPSEWSRFESVANSKGSGTTPSRWDNGYSAVLRLEIKDSTLQLFQRWSSQNSSESQPPSFAYIPDAKWTDMSTVVEARNTLELSRRVKLESALTFNRYEILPESKYIFQKTSTDWGVNSKYGIGTSGTLEEKFEIAASKDLLVSAGMSVGSYNIVPKATIPGGVDRSGDIISQAGDLTYYTEAGNPNSVVHVPGAYDLTYQDVGIFAEGAWRVLPPLKIILGARVDQDSRFNKVPLSPRAAAIYNLSPHWVTKYIHSEAYVAPAPYFAYNVFANSTIVNISNKSLQPEEATSDEINMEYHIHRWTTGGSVYHNRQKNLTVIGNSLLPQNILNPVVYLDAAGTQPRVLTQTANAGRSTAQGLDIYTRFSWDQNDLWASYSFINFNSKTDGIETGLQGISRHQGRLGLTMAVLRNLFLTPSIVIRSTPEFIKDQGTLSSYLINPYQVNLSVVYSPRESVDIFGTILNLTNHHYALSALALNAAPREALEASIGVRWKFL